MYDQNPKKPSPPDDIDDYLSRYTRKRVREEAQKQGVDPDLAERQFGAESSYRPEVIKGQRRSSAGAIGAGQLMPGTAKDLGVDPYHIDENISGSVRYMKQQLDAFGGDSAKAAAAYNWGPGNVKKYGLSNAPAETQNYVKNVAGQQKDDVDEFLSRWKEPSAPRVSPFDETEDQAKARRAGMTRTQRKQDQRQTIGAMQNELVKSSRIMQPPTPPSGKATAGVFGQSRKGQAELKKAFRVDPSTGIQIFEDAGINRVNQRAAMPATPESIKRRKAVEAERARFQQRSLLGRAAETAATQFALNSPEWLTPEAQQDINTRALALGLEPAKRDEWIYKPGTQLARSAARTAASGIQGTAELANLFGRLSPGEAQALLDAADTALGAPKGYSAQKAKELLASARELPGKAEQVTPLADPTDESWLGAKIPQAFGSAAVFGPLGQAGQALRIPGAVVSGMTGAAIGAGQQNEAARKAGVSQERQDLATLLGALSGSTEALGFERLMGGTGAVPAPVKEVVKDAVQEYGQQYLDDINAKYVGGYDPNASMNPLSRDKVEAAALGGIVSGTMSAPSVIANRAANARNIQQIQAERAPMPGIAPSVPAGTQTQITRLTPEAARAASQPVAPSVTPDIANAPTTPLTEPIATPIPSEAIPAPSQPNAPLFPAAQQQAQPDLTKMSAFDRLAAMQAQRQGIDQRSVEQRLNEGYAQAAGLVEGAGRIWDADRGAAEQMVETADANLRSALKDVRGSQAYQQELSAVAQGGQPGVYMNAVSAIKDRLAEVDRLRKLDATREKESTRQVKEVQASQKAAAKEPVASLDDLRMQAEGFKQQAAEAEQAGNLESAKTAYKSAYDILQDIKKEYRKAMSAAERGALGQDINLQHNRLKQTEARFRKQERDLQRQANKPTAGIQQPRRQAAQQPPPLMRSGAIVNPEGGIPAQAPKPKMTFTEELQRGIDQSDAARAKRKPQKRLLSRIAELGGISEEYRGELQSVADARRIGVIRKKPALSPDILAEQLREDGYDVDPNDLNTLWRAIDEDMSSERGFRPADSAALDRRLAEEEAAYYEQQASQRKNAQSPVSEQYAELLQTGEPEQDWKYYQEGIANKRAAVEETRAKLQKGSKLVTPDILRQQEEDLASYIQEAEAFAAQHPELVTQQASRPQSQQLRQDTGGLDQAEAAPAQVKMMLTRDDRQQLLDLGYSRSDIDTMSPAEGQQIITEGRTKGSRQTEPDSAEDLTPDTEMLREAREFTKREQFDSEYTEEPPTAPLARRPEPEAASKPSLRESVAKGEFGKLSEFTRRRATEGRSLAGNDELRELLGLSPMPPYRSEETGKTAEWGQAAQETLDSLAELAGFGTQRSSEMGIEGLWRAFAELEKRAKAKGTKISPELEDAFVWTAKTYKMAFLEPYMRLHETNQAVADVYEQIQGIYEQGKQLTREQQRDFKQIITDAAVAEGLKAHFVHHTLWPQILNAGRNYSLQAEQASGRRDAGDVQGERVEAKPAPTGRVIQHSQFGEVREAADQSGVAKGKLRVVDSEGAEHVIQNPRTSGNKNAAFAKSEKAEASAGKAEPLPPDAYAEARKRPDGKYQLFYRGTRNEVFPSELFNSASEAKQYLKAQRAKRDAARSATDVDALLAAGAIAPEQAAKMRRKPKISERRERADVENSPEFKRWFGNSVVTEDGKPGGKPLVVYHGTQADFDEFQGKGRAAFGQGYYFARTPAIADYFSGHNRAAFKGAVSKNSNTIPAYLAINNPLIIRNAKANGEGEVYIRGRLEKLETLPAQWLEDEIEQRGHDGIFVYGQGAKENAPPSYIVARESSQIKSAFNRGTFDPQSPKISERREAPGAMPERYTGRQLFENARVEFRPARNRPATLIANDWGGAMMNRLLSDTFGESTTDANFTVAADDMRTLRDRLAEARDSGIYDEAQTANMDALLGQIDAAIKDAKANNQDVAFVTRKAGEPISQTKIKVRHETAHVSQSRVTPDMFALTERGWLGRQPEAAAVRAELERRGYPPETHAHESAVFVASGDFAAFGMNLDQATNFIEKYFRAVIQKHGRRALDRFGAIDPRLQPTLERARNEKTEAGQARIERRVSSEAPGTRRTGAAGAEAGRSGAGVLAGRREESAGVPEGTSRKPRTRSEVENSPEFKRWFGNSVVTEDGKPGGKPLVVYHGTNRSFAEFSPKTKSSKTGNPNAQLGYFFSNSPNEASRYSKDWGQADGNVMPVYLSIQNPYQMSYKEFDDLAMAAFRSMTSGSNYDPNAVIRFGDTEGQRKAAARLAKHEQNAREQSEKRRKELITEGYDGIVVKIGGGREYIAFSPTQIKSAFNRGTFDPQSPKISERKEGKFSFGRLENEPEGQIAAAGLGALQNLAGKIKKTKTPDAVPADYDVWDFYDQVMKQIMPGKDKQGNPKPPKTKINNEQADAIANGLLEMVEAADKQDFVGIFNAREKVRQAMLPAAKRDVKWYDHMQSRLSNLNFRGTYERIAGADGKAVSEILRQAQVDIANGEVARAEAVKNLRKELRPYIRQFQIAGKPGLARWIENHIDAVTDPDQSFKGLAGFMKGGQFYAKLAYNPRSAMINMFQPMQTLWPHLSTREWLAIQKRATSRKEWQRIGEIAARESGGSVEGLARPDVSVSTWRQAVKTGFFGYASEYNRVVGHLAGEMMADRQGITGREKARMAADWAKKVEFDNSQWDIPPLFSGPIAGVVGQFKPFMVKNLERLYADWKSSPYSHQKGKDYKYINPSGNLARRSKMIVGQVALGGIRSAIPGLKHIGGVLILGGLAKAFGKFMDDDDAEKMAEAVYFGLPALVEQDLSGSVTVFDEPFGKTAEEKMVNFFGGPTLSLAAKAWNTYGKVTDAKDTDKSTAAEKRKRALLSLGKAVSPYVKTGQAIAAAAKGETPKMWMGKEVPMTKKEAIGYGLMGTPLRQSKYWEHEEAPDWQKEVMPDRFTQSASTKTEFLNKFGQMSEQEIKRKPGEPDAVYQKRVERVSGWMNTYGEKLVNHPLYNLLTAEQKQKAIENLRDRVGRQMNLVRPNERTLEPQEVIKAVRKAATRKPRRGSEQLWEPEN